MTQKEGSCSCRAVRYRLLADPLFVHCCHCLLCQKQTGSAFVINAMFEADRVELLEGTPVPVSMPTDSGRTHLIYRCSTCQIAVWSDYGGKGVLRFVRVLTLDEPHTIVPDVHIYTRSKVPWVTLPTGVRAFAEFYDRKTEWPAESQERLAKRLAETK